MTGFIERERKILETLDERDAQIAALRTRLAAALDDKAEAELQAASLRMQLHKDDLKTLRIQDERDAARADAAQLAAAIQRIAQSNGYKLDPPDWYTDDHAWYTSAGAIRACAAALAAHREIAP